MSVVLKQSTVNTITMLLAVLIGGFNTMVLYVHFLEEQYFGLITFILSTAFVLKPLMSLGVNYTIIKFYTSYQTKKERDVFLSSALWVPLLIVLPVGLITMLFYGQLSALLSKQNEIVKNYAYLIFLVAVFTAYFEVFYSWAKVQMASVFGNVLNELFVRICATILLTMVAFHWISAHQMVIYLVGCYLLQCLLMAWYAFKLYKPKFYFHLPHNFKEVLQYSLYIIMASAAATTLIDIDKFIIPQLIAIEQVAFYSVAVYIGTIIEIPGRAMQQIIQPVTAKAINENNLPHLQSLYTKSSITSLVAAGLIFVLVCGNINELFLLMPSDYATGVWVVVYTALAKLYHMFLGNNGIMITNSKYYKILLPYGIAMALSVAFLNYWFIKWFGIVGAASSTLLVIVIFNTIKLWYVQRVFKMHPITLQTGLSLVVIAVFTGIGWFWKIPLHPILSIVLKSILLGGFYLLVSYLLKLSLDINRLIITYWEKIF